MTVERKQIRTAIYAAGGMATKRVSEFQNLVSQNKLTHLDYYYVDTSASDMNKDIPASDIFIVPGMDGAGKDRRLAYTQVLPHVPSILQAFPPKDFNIVVQSASGGSGSAVGPAIVNKLLEEGQDVVLFIVGSVGSKKEVENTLGTLRTYANFSDKYKKPLLVYYRENNPTNTRTQVDELVNSALFMTSLLLSSENRGLDTADLQNLLNYQRVTSFEPELSSFDFHVGEITLPETVVPQAAAILFADRQGSTDGVETGTSLLEYRAEGFLSKERTEQLGEKAPLFAVCYTGDLVERIKYLEGHLTRFEASERARKSKVASVTAVDTDNEDGMVF